MRNSPTDEHLLKQMEEIEYVKEARNYLLSFDDVNENILDAQLHEWKEKTNKSRRLISGFPFARAK